MRFAVCLVFLSGCAGSLVEIPRNANVVRCTEYSGNGSAPMMSTSVRADGCQCYTQGEVTAEIQYQGEKCSLKLGDQ